MLTFFYSTATCSTAIHIALEEAGIPFKGIEVSWQRKLHLEELAAVNPLGQVPVLVNEGRAMNQGLAIMEYLADHSPGKNLLPKGSWERAQAMSWLAFASSDFQKSFLLIGQSAKMASTEAAQKEVKSFGTQMVDKYLAYIDQSLAGKEFLVANQFTVADAYLFVILGWCKWSQVKTSAYKNVTAYMKRIYERPAVQKVLTAEGMMDFLPE